MKNNCPIYIINLESSIDRKKFIENQLNSCLDKDIKYIFFSAIRGKDNPNFYLFEKYNEKKRFLRKGNVMSLSQLGCFASHYLLWEKCIELNTGIIILEDDAILQDNFLDIYRFCSSDYNQSEFFWLSPPAFETLKGNERLKIDNTNKLIRFTGKHDNATGYYLTPKAAKKLLDHCQEWIYEVDITMDRFWENHLDILNVDPPCIRPSFEFNTNIDVDKNKKNRTLKIKLLREFYKIIDIIKKSIYLIKSK